MKIYLATGNLNKKREMAQILSEHEIVIPSDEGIEFDPDETGTTFYENSLIKAKALYDIVHLIHTENPTEQKFHRKNRIFSLFNS